MNNLRTAPFSVRRRAGDEVKQFTMIKKSSRSENLNIRVPKEWRKNKQDKYNNIVDTLNNMADEIVDSHQNLIRIAKQKLF